MHRNVPVIAGAATCAGLLSYGAVTYEFPIEAVLLSVVSFAVILTPYLLLGDRAQRARTGVAVIALIVLCTTTVASAIAVVAASDPQGGLILLWLLPLQVAVALATGLPVFQRKDRSGH